MRRPKSQNNQKSNVVGVCCATIRPVILFEATKKKVEYERVPRRGMIETYGFLHHEPLRGLVVRSHGGWLHVGLSSECSGVVGWTA